MDAPPQQHMDVTIRSSPDDIDVEGDEFGLRFLAEALRETREVRHIQLPRPAGSPSPYDAFATALTIDPLGGDVRVSVADDRIVISGSPDKLEVVAESLDTLAECEATSAPRSECDHIHIEYFSGNSYVHPESVPLVLSRPRIRPRRQ
jgi:hypothetical protein